MPFVATTRLRLRSLRFVPGLIWYAFRSRRQAKSASGNLSAETLREANHTFWTCSVWRDEDAMRAFMTSGAHRTAMRYLPEWCDEASVADWHQNSPEPPGWPEVYRRMQSEGRRSKVRHPSSAHQRFEIAPPRP
jgi:quinol monooxygenase YgiN